jgi:hypothetical protein
VASPSSYTPPPSNSGIPKSTVTPKTESDLDMSQFEKF